MPEIKTDIFVIGTGPAGMTAARTAKRKKPELSVTAIRQEPSYVPCALPYALSGAIKVDSYVKNETSLMTDIGIDLLDGQVVRISPEEHKVFLLDGRVYRYGRLIAAPGAEPVIPPIPGIDTGHVFSLRTPADIHAILNAVKPESRIAVVGAGYIGLEVACACKEAGCQVDLIEIQPCPLPNITDSDFTHLVRHQLEARKVALHLGVGLQEIVSADTDRVQSLILSDGSKLPADVLVLCLGVRPRLQLFLDAGIQTKKDGVIVDAHMQTSAQDIYACGDCTHFSSFVTGQDALGKLATNGIFQGKTAALNAIGIDRVFAGFINTCVTDVFGLRIGSTGIREEEASKAGMTVVTGIGISRSAYPMFSSSREVKVKLVIDRLTKTILGGMVAGPEGVAERLDLIALAIQQRLKVNDLITLNHCAHPVQSGVPAHNPIVMAAEDAFSKLR